MIAVARQLLSVSCEWAGDLRHAGHNQDPSDLGGHSPDGLQVHASRVPKAPNRSESPTLEGTPPGRALEGSRRVWIRLRASDCQQVVSNDSTRGLASHHGASSLNLSEPR